ncbi:hypothetical protein IB211_00956c [Intestinimonas butyriciproducens]|uniref:Lipoprotein n=1 Tax=Intestinimonas butyriciproducens TaxID=1297617 RepID=A0A0S2W1X9_9FIRM|nr:hypothetical protein IB211_00956c [Intestinimonas butyriciproducens]
MRRRVTSSPYSLGLLSCFGLIFVKYNFKNHKLVSYYFFHIY